MAGQPELLPSLDLINSLRIWRRMKHVSLGDLRLLRWRMVEVVDVGGSIQIQNNVIMNLRLLTLRSRHQHVQVRNPLWVDGLTKNISYLQQVKC